MTNIAEYKIKPEEIIRIIFKRRWFIIIPLFLAIIIGAYLSVTLVRYYRASTTIMVQSQRVPSSYVQSVVTEDISSRLRSITQEVLSRTNLERIIKDYNLFADPDERSMFMEDKVASVRRRIQVNVNQSSTFTISYVGRDPVEVKDITNALASIFIDENLKDREEQATGTGNFLESELETMRKRLEKSEDELRNYRQKYMGELPGQLEANLSILGRLQEQLLEKQKALRETSNTKSSLENQIAKVRQNAQESLMKNGAEEGGKSADLEQLQAQLAVLQARYTDSHPSVVRLKNMISKVEENIKKGDFEGDTMTTEEKQLAALKLEIPRMESEISELKKKADIYQARVENTPKREEELYSIQRDYDNMKKIYDSLVSRRLEAEISVNMEKKQKGEQFQIIDPARVPEKPVYPNMNRLFLGSIFIGLFVGGGSVFLLERMSKTFKGIDDVESTLGLPVLATVPAVLHAKDKTMIRLNNIFSIASIVLTCFLFGGFAFLTLMGVDKTITMVKTIINL